MNEPLDLADVAELYRDAPKMGASASTSMPMRTSIFPGGST